MNRPKAIRLGFSLAVTVVAVVAAFVPSAFGAIGTTASTTYESTVPGAHTDYTIRQDFTYGNGAEPTATTGAGQDLKKWIVDSPAGLVGNPNAIPYEDRCDPASFNPAPSSSLTPFFNGSCPDSAQVGEAQIYLVNDANSGTCPNAPLQCIVAGQDMAALSGPMQGKIYILKTDPEIPVTLGTILTSASYQNFDFSAYGGNVCTTAPGTPCPIYPKTKSILAPVTNLSDTASGGGTDFRIRTIPAEDSAPPSALLPTAYGHPSLGSGGTPLHIRRIDQKLYGMADPNDNFPTAGDGDSPFLVMPSRCDSWDSYSYAVDHTGSGSGSLAMDPNNPSVDYYVQSAADSVTPDCSSVPPLKAATSASVTGTTARNANPGLNVVVADTTAFDDQQPKKIVTTLPSSISVDVDALGNVCTTEQRDAEACPAASQVGTAKIETPLISAGLTGKVYMTTGATNTLPYLSIFVDGAVKFRLDATTKFVGPQFNQIETTFDNLPQTPFTKFTVDIAGGASNSLLYSRACPTDGSSPNNGNITFAVNGYSGSASTSESSAKFDNCYGKPSITKISNCIKVSRTIKSTPRGLVDKANIMKVQFQDGTKKTNLKTRATDKADPFKFKFTLKKSKYKKNKKYYFGYRVVYKDGVVVKSNVSTFKTCK